MTKMNRLLDYIVFQLGRSQRTMVSSIIYYARGRALRQ